MARHMDAGLDPFQPPPPVPPRRRGNRLVGWVSAGVVGLLVLGACLPFVLPGVLTGVRSKLPWFPAPPCPATTVLDVVSAPLVTSSVAGLVAGLENHRLSDGSCLSVRVRQQNPTDTVASSSVLPPARAPQVWVSDSSFWLAQITRWKEQSVGSFGSTPVIAVSSGTALNSAKNRPWTSANPSWASVFSHAAPLVIPNLNGAAQGPLALISLWDSAGKGTAADRLVAAATLAATHNASSATQDEADALSAIVTQADAGTPDADAPFVISTEQAMVTINQDSAREVLTPIYPSDGSPFLDFPIVRLAGDQQDADHREGADLVMAALQGAQARAAAHALGLRDPDGGNAPTSQRGLPVKVTPSPFPPVSDLTRFLARFAALAIPSRILVALDLSASMKAVVPGTGLSRVALASEAAVGVGTLLPDSSSVGLWAFAAGLGGAKPYRELAPVEPLGQPDGNVVHRDNTTAGLLQLARQTGAGGTSLYLTAVDAVRSLRSSYDPRASNSVVVFTAGATGNDNQISLQQAVSELKSDAAANPGSPVRLICVGIGPDTDVNALQALADATGGASYQAQTADQLKQVLYDAIARRS